MAKQFLRLFIKNWDQTSNPTVRSAVGQLAGVIGIICNLLLFIGKLLIGVLATSVSIIADALNNLTDAASSIVTLVGFRLAQRPADRQHPYGHGRYEYLSGLAVSVLILFIGFELMKSSIEKIFFPADSDYTWIMLVILAATMAVKLWMSILFRGFGKHIQSPTLQAAAIDCRNDIITTSAILLGCAVEYLFHIRIDGYMGLGVSIFVLCSGIKMARETISPLLGSQADEEIIAQLSDLILSHEKIIGIHDLLVHDYGPGQCYATVHAELNAQFDPIVCHDIIDHIEAEVLQSMNIRLVIHFDPVSVDDEERNQINESVQASVAGFYDKLSVHDLRIDRNTEPNGIFFDLTVPYGYDLDSSELEAAIRKALPSKWACAQIEFYIDRI